MSTVVALLLVGPPTRAAPTGSTAGAFAEAMAEDVLGVLTGLEDIADAVVHSGPWSDVAGRIAWPGTLLVPLPDPEPAAILTAALTALGALGFTRAVLVAPDAPDLPALHLAKVLRALDSTEVATVPAHGGGLIALAARVDAVRTGRIALPVDLDGAAPSGARPTLAWRRIRTAADLARLDPGLEGWESSRALLGI